jgi:hypothetical protein
MLLLSLLDVIARGTSSAVYAASRRVRSPNSLWRELIQKSIASSSPLSLADGEL